MSHFFMGFTYVYEKPEFMRSLVSFLLLFVAVSTLTAQTPIDELQKQNLSFLEGQERDGYAFRSQIITEFDAAHASQNVNIKLSESYTYVIVALGDSNIPEISLDIKPAKGAKMELISNDSGLAGQSFRLEPSRSGKFKISINTSGLSGDQRGFVSFMVLRK